MFKTIVWATDGSESADAGLEYAKSLAVQNGAALVVAHAVEHMLGPRSGGHAVHADEDEIKAKIARQTAELKEAGLNVSTKEVGGASPGAAHMIADIAREVSADVIVIGTRGHTALAGLLLGSVTQRLLHVAPCPVLAVPAIVAHNG